MVLVFQEVLRIVFMKISVILQSRLFAEMEFVMMSVKIVILVRKIAGSAEAALPVLRAVARR